MTEPSMVERVARAIVDRRHGKGAFIHGENLADARAAIEAMREPTEEMREAWGAEDCDDHPAECHINPRRWSAMIDAALGSRP